ncbi:MAG: hypothetical protein IT381_08900 [Deltaproteobacteria bacterium]|nr:hypothetical protein [Deltaproteobacteria bacterium]
MAAEGSPPFYRSTAFKVGVAALILAGIGTLVSRIDTSKNLKKLQARMLSGAPEGNYYALVTRMAALAEKQQGKIENVSSAGSVDNLKRLVAAREGACDAHFGLIQEGQDWPEKPKLETLGRLPRAESVFFLGKDANQLKELASIAKMRIGIGPPASGTEKIARQIFESRDLAPLALVLSNHTLAEQLDLLSKGQLDLGVFVMDRDGPLIDRAIREHGLQIAGFAHAEVLAGKVPHLSLGRIEAGHYDPVKVLPPEDKPVLQISTLVVGNGCASRSATVGMLSVLDATFPDFLRFNKATANTSGLELAGAAKSFYENEGPDPFDEYAPWLVDIMPPGKWVYLVTALSILFNIMGFGNRFQLWRIDASRVKTDAQLMAVFGQSVTIGDIARMEPPKERRAEIVQGVRDVMKELEVLAAKSRKQSLSILVPMGGELAYRYQESLMFESMTVLRAFLERCGAA